MERNTEEINSMTTGFQVLIFKQTNLYAESNHSAICKTCIKDPPSTVQTEHSIFQFKLFHALFGLAMERSTKRFSATKNNSRKQA